MKILAILSFNCTMVEEMERGSLLIILAIPINQKDV